MRPPGRATPRVGAASSPASPKPAPCQAMTTPARNRFSRRTARRAYRRPVTDNDLRTLMEFYAAGARDGGFEAGIQLALERILVSPDFLFRIESDQAPSKGTNIYTLTDVELASRLSFFLWSSIPDDQLLEVAAKGRLKDPKVLEQQVRRMLADPRSSALVDNFAGQWLVLRNVRDRGARSRSLPGLRRQPARRLSARDRALSRKPAARGSQRRRSAQRELLVPERAAGAALRRARMSTATASAA